MAQINSLGPSRRYALPAKIQAKAREMHEVGMSFRKIGRELDIHHATVKKYVLNTGQAA